MGDAVAPNFWAFYGLSSRWLEYHAQMIIFSIILASLSLTKAELFACLDYTDAKEQQACIDRLIEKSRADSTKPARAARAIPAHTPADELAAHNSYEVTKHSPADKSP